MFGEPSRAGVTRDLRHVVQFRPPFNNWSIDPGGSMAGTKISPKLQVVIPKEVRERMGLRAGQEMQVVEKGDMIVLVPERSLSSLRGFARGISTENLREKKDRM
jgi:AbrB family looped-hinge helix DNA binding protein